MYGELKCFIKPFTRLETSSNTLSSHQKILQKNLDFLLSIIRKLLSIDQVLFSIGRTGIKQWSSHPEIQGFFLYHFDRSSQNFNQSKMLNFEFHLENSRTWIHFNNFMNNIFQTQTSLLLQSILVYTYIYNNSYSTERQAIVFRCKYVLISTFWATLHFSHVGASTHDKLFPHGKICFALVVSHMQ